MTFFNYLGYLEGIKRGAQGLSEPERTIVLTKYKLLVAQADFEDRAWTYPKTPDAAECQKYIDLIVQLAQTLPRRDRNWWLKKASTFVSDFELSGCGTLRGPSPSLTANRFTQFINRLRKQKIR